jgi:hypothetical protein
LGNANYSIVRDAGPCPGRDCCVFLQCQQRSGSSGGSCPDEPGGGAQQGRDIVSGPGCGEEYQGNPGGSEKEFGEYRAVDGGSKDVHGAAWAERDSAMMKWFPAEKYVWWRMMAFVLAGTNVLWFSLMVPHGRTLVSAVEAQQIALIELYRVQHAREQE